MTDTVRWILTSVRRAGWAPVAVFLAHVILSRGSRAYAAFPTLDLLMHLVGGVAIAYFAWRALGLSWRLEADDAMGVGIDILALFGITIASLVFLVIAVAVRSRRRRIRDRAGSE